MEEKESVLNSTIQSFYEDKKQLDYYKECTDKSNREIKKLFTELNRTEFETDNGLVAKVTTQKRESFDEDKLLQKIKELNVPNIIKTKEYVDMDELENAIYNGNLDASELQSARITKEVVTLKVTQKKENK